MEEKDFAISLPLQVSELAQTLIFATISILSFFLPFVLGNPQWIVGTTVNAFLFLSAIFLPKKYILPLAVFPSLGVLARGIVFGPFTSFLVYFLPFIWLGNLVLIFTFKKAFACNVKNTGILYAAGVLGSSAFKFLLLLAIANIYFGFHLVPKLFLQSMGVFQLLTALAGGAISFLIFSIYKQKYGRKFESRG